MKLLWKHMQDNRHRFVLALSIGIIYTAISVIVPTISGELINGFIGGLPNGMKILLLYLVCSGLQIVFSFLTRKLQNTLTRTKSALCEEMSSVRYPEKIM